VIECCCFKDSALRRLDLFQTKVRRLGRETCSGFSKLQEVSLPGSLLVLKSGAFSGVELSVLFLPVANRIGFGEATFVAVHASLFSGLVGLEMLQTHPIPAMQ
jgi:hypothetical protein